jgi:hypothetical protein
MTSNNRSISSFLSNMASNRTYYYILNLQEFYKNLSLARTGPEMLLGAPLQYMSVNAVKSFLIEGIEPYPDRIAFLRVVSQGSMVYLSQG